MVSERVATESKYATAGNVRSVTERAAGGRTLNEEADRVGKGHGTAFVVD